MNLNLSNKYILALTFFLLGGLVFLGINTLINKNHQKQNNKVVDQEISSVHNQKFLDNFFNRDFFDKSRDPFAEMHRMRKEMMDLFNADNDFGGAFDNWYQDKFGGGDIGDIKQREDDQYIYYDIAIPGLTPTEVKVEVDDRNVSISGKFERKSNTKDSNSYMSSNFQRIFPLPSGVSSRDYKMEQEENKIIIKFTKVK